MFHSLNNYFVPRAWSLGLGLLFLTSLASLLFGAGEISWWRSLNWLLQNDDEQAGFVILELRVTRTLLAIIVGAALSAAGAVLQALTRNPLAEPGLLGVSAGASFAVVVAIFFGASAANVGIWVAIIGALIGCLLVIAVSRVSGAGQDPVRLILAGTAFSGLLLSLTSLLLLTDQRTADEMRFWLIGALAGRSKLMIYWAAFCVLLGIGFIISNLRALAAMALGETLAQGLGHNPKLIQTVVIIGVAILVGSATAVAGPIAFVGLVVPFLVRTLVGSDIRRVFYLSLIYGPVIVLFADIVSRLVVRPYELPVGVVTAFIGAPILMFVVRQHRMPTL